jgi:hypothetical protein
MLPRRVAPLALAATILASAAGAGAQDASSKAAAEALFRDGRALYDQGRYPEACAKFAESQRLDPAPGTLLNLAGCYEKNGQTASAWVTFKEAVSAAHVKGRADWEDLARQRAAALEPTLSHLTITVTAPAEGLVVKRDGAEVGRAEWGTAIPVDPGTHVVEATAPHRQPLRQSVDVGASGASASITVPELAADVGAGTGGTPARPGSTQRTVGLAIAGVGLAGVVVGSAFGFVAMGKENDALNNHCSGNQFCDPQGLQLGDDAKSAATVSTIGFAVGAAAMAGGLVLYFTAPKAESTVAPATPPVALRASPTRGGAGLALEGLW